MNSPNITVESLHNALEALNLMDSSRLQKSIFENLVSIFGEDSSGVIYDATNTHLAGSRSELAKKGKDKEGVRGRRLIQIGLGVTRKLGLPIFHHARGGNIHDVRMFKEAIDQFKLMNLKPGLMVFDRGMTSKTCVSQLHDTGWKSLAGVPMHRGIQTLISKMDISQIEKFRYLVPLGANEMFVKPIPYTLGNVTGKLLIMINSSKKQAIGRERRLNIIAARNEFRNDGIEVQDDFVKYFNKSGVVDWHAISRAEQYDGLSFIFTDAKISTHDAVKTYFAKDLVERCFKLEKSVAKLRPIRFWLDHKISAHILICHFALAILTTCRIRLGFIGISDDISIVLRNLSSIYKIQLGVENSKDKKSSIHFSKVNTLSNAQKSYIKAMAPKISV